MANLRQAGSRQAEAQAAAEIRLWGCETDAAGAPTGAAPSSAGHVGRAATATGGRAAGGGAAGGDGAEGVDADNALFVPFEPACDENWQLAMQMPAGRKMVRQLMFVNGVEADELTLAELHASVLSEDALSLAQEGD
ncbi:unnamed protein product, partial [Ectocarpus sp. 12 AP-2014]